MDWGAPAADCASDGEVHVPDTQLSSDMLAQLTWQIDPLAPCCTMELVFICRL